VSRSRVSGIDVIRGVVMVLMAIDHVRLYGGVPAGGPTAGLFFTRWVTHFCAPAFVFLAGASAFLHGRSAGNQTLSRFLFTRGLLLVALELTVVKFSWGFNLDYAAFTLAGVIWMIGWCMVLMSLLVRTGLNPRAIGLLGVAIVFIQPVFAYVPRLLPGALRAAVGPFWAFIYPSGVEAAGGVQVLYVIVPWIGVMAAGYGFGLIVAKNDDARRRWCLRIGLGATALFLLVAIPAALMQPASLQSPPLLFRVLGQNKYPASPLFLLMTLGPTIALLPMAERARGRLAGVFETFGRVPMFYYLLHIPAIHLAALVTAWLRGDGIHHEWYRSAPFAQVPPSARWSLGELYLVFAIVAVILYFPCAWYARQKMRSPRPRWMTYI
jgi:uncharacterized membrane protein